MHGLDGPPPHLMCCDAINCGGCDDRDHHVRPPSLVDASTYMHILPLYHQNPTNLNRFKTIAIFFLFYIRFYVLNG